MTDRSILTNSLKRLEEELRRSGKIETANFFNKSITTITFETDDNVLRELLKQLCNSGAMIQYANFSFKEEQLFDKSYDEAKKLLKMI